MLGCKSTNLDAAVDSAGGFIIQDEHTPQRPVSPIDMISTLSCPLMGLFGEEDPNPSPEHAARMQEELDKHGKTYTFHMYRDAGHCLFRRLSPQLPRRPRPGHVAPRHAVLRRASQGIADVAELGWTGTTLEGAERRQAASARLCTK